MRPTSLAWTRAVWVAAVALATVGFYTWCVRPQQRDDLIVREAHDYHSLQVSGFLKGQLAMDVAVEPALATLDNPWDPAQRAGRGLADASYYNGRYFLYFGLTPMVLLMLPFRLLTGYYLTEPLACLIFASVGFFVSGAQLTLVRRRHFPGTPPWVEAGGWLALGLGNLMPLMLRRPSMWEVPIAAGHACFMIALVCLFQAWHHPNRQRWLIGCSVAMGLAVGARHTYLVAFLGVAYCLRQWAPEGSKGLRAWWADAAWRRATLAACLPAAIIGLGLGWYNYARFGNPLEFGQTYQFSSDDLSKARFFGLDYFWFGLRVYLLSAAGWSPYFPFVTPIEAPPFPTGYYGIENPYGLLPNLPFVVLGLALLLLRRATQPADRILGWYVGAVSLSVTALALVLMAYVSAINRYMIYFTPGYVFLACLGWMLVERQSWFRGSVRVLGRSVVVALLGFTLGFNVLVAFQHNNLLRHNHPAVYASMARAGNGLVAPLEEWADVAYGPLELEVIFPDGLENVAEPLVVTGAAHLSDYLYVAYERNNVRFGFEHTSHGGGLSAPVRITPGRTHHIRVEMGSLYPPREHPYYDGMRPDQIRLRRHALSVRVDDVIVLHRVAEFYDPTSWTPSIGTAAGRPAFGRDFSGKILHWGRRPELAPNVADFRQGPVRLELRLPAIERGKSEPLLSTGVAGRADLIFVNYLGGNRLRFGHDHWGHGGTTSSGTVVPTGEAVVIEIDTPALHDPSEQTAEADGRLRGRVIVRVNGRVVLDESTLVYPSTPEDVVVGQNPLGFTTAEPAFSGTIDGNYRLQSRLVEP